MSKIRIQEKCVVTDGRVCCPVSGADMDVENCFGCDKIVNVSENGKEIHCVAELQLDDLEPV